jgi:hypothetical protein
MYTAEQMRKDAREGKFIIMVISVTAVLIWLLTYI